MSQVAFLRFTSLGSARGWLELNSQCFALLACLLACLVLSVCLALLLLFLLFFLLHLLRLATVTATATPPATKMLQSRIVAGDNTLAGKQVALV